jgi:hypothetical protein
MPDEIKWSVGSSGGNSGQKIQYIPLKRSSDKLSDVEKEENKLWNLMVNTLRNNGMMEDKE